jgi:hypothetical protein
VDPLDPDSDPDPQHWRKEYTLQLLPEDFKRTATRINRIDLSLG